MRRYSLTIPLKASIVSPKLPEGWSIKNGYVRSPIIDGSPSHVVMEVFLALRKAGAVLADSPIGVAVDVQDFSLEQLKNLCKRYLKFELAFDLTQPKSDSQGWPEYHHFNAAYDDIDKSRSLMEVVAIVNAPGANKFKFDIREYVLTGRVSFWHQTAILDEITVGNYLQTLLIFVEDSAEVKVRRSSKDPKVSNLLVGLFACKGFSQLREGNRRHLYHYFRDRARQFHPDLMEMRLVEAQP